MGVRPFSGWFSLWSKSDAFGWPFVQSWAAAPPLLWRVVCEYCVPAGAGRSESTGAACVPALRDDLSRKCVAKTICDLCGQR
jgi:hypothetical protein